MEVIVAPHAGFCFGVEKAVKTVYEEAASGAPTYTYGPIIHNETVVNDLEGKGVHIADADSLTDFTQTAAKPATTPTMVLRSHGVGRAEEEAIRGKGYRVVDATCPFVKRIHTIVHEASGKGDVIVIVGDPEHAEVRSIAGWVDGPVYVLKDEVDARAFQIAPDAPVTLVSQTTFRPKKFQEILAILSQSDYNIHVVNTICNATEVRQTEAEELASSVDAMIVIGGKGSSNSQKLFNICKEKCEHTFFIQTLDDLPGNALQRARKVGITAGASTPKKIIEEVQEYVRTNF